MFTGIIESIGSIRALTPKGGDVRVHVCLLYTSDAADE